MIIPEAVISINDTDTSTNETSALKSKYVVKKITKNIKHNWKDDLC